MKARYVILGALIATGAWGCDGILGIVLLDGTGLGDAGLDGAGPADGGGGDAGADVSSADGSSDASDGALGDGSFDAADALDAAPDGDGQTPDGGCFPRPSELVSWWRAEGTADDSVGPNNGTPTNVTFVPGVVGRAFHFAGDGDVLAGATGIPTGASERTIEMWLRLDATYPAGPPFVEGLFFGYGGWGTLNGTYSLLVTAGGLTNTPQDTLTFSQWGQTLPSRSLTENTWHHVAATLKSGTLTIYLDGAGVTSETGSLTIDTSAGGSLYMGGIASQATGVVDRAWLKGDLDEVAAYTRALAPEEIQGIVNAGSAGKCP